MTRLPGIDPPGLWRWWSYSAAGTYPWAVNSDWIRLTAAAIVSALVRVASVCPVINASVTTECPIPASIRPTLPVATLGAMVERDALSRIRASRPVNQVWPTLSSVEAAT